jgi:hypothetical protein
MTTVADTNFWSADDKLPISQKSVSIPSANGLSYSDGQRISIEVPPTVEYIQPRECYLSFDIKLALPPAPARPTALQLDSILGGQSVIKDLRIYSGGAGKVLLEEFQDYNVLTNIKYTYSTNDVIRAKRALTEGSTVWSSVNRGTCGTTQSHQAQTSTNPWFRKNAAGVADVFSNDNFQTVKCLLPINTGLFQNSKILPVLMLDGLVLDIILEDATRCVRQLDSTRLLTRQGLKPVFHSIDGVLGAGAKKITAKTPFKNLYLANDNNIFNVDNCPFVVGERVNFVELATGAVTDTDANPFVIAAINVAGAGGPPNTTNLVQLTSVANAESTTDVDVGGLFGVYSASVAEQIGVGGYTPSYTVSNVELILQQLEMPQGYTSKMRAMMKEGGVMNYDYLSFTNYKYSQLSSDTVTNMRLPLNQSRCKAILSVPTDSSIYDSAIAISGGVDSTAAPAVKTYEYLNTFPSADGAWYSDTSGFTGITDSLNNYQYFYDGKLNPSRKVDCVKTSGTSISSNPLIELEKALAQSDIVPYSFRMFKESFCVGRALSLHNGVYDARGRDFNVQLEYDAGQYKNKLWHNFVSHIRRIQFKGDGISVLV